MKKIVQLKDDGAGGYWLHFNSTAPKHNQWYRITQGNISEAKAMDERAEIDQLLSSVSGVVEQKPTSELLSLGHSLAAKFSTHAGIIETLAVQQMSPSAAAKLIKPLNQAADALSEWIRKAQAEATMEAEYAAADRPEEVEGE